MPKRRSILRNIALNFFGLAAPLLVGVACIPMTIRGYGMAEFGLLSIVWVLIGYISIFDLGLGRALTHAVARRLGEGREVEVHRLVMRTLAVLLALSVIGSTLAFFLAPWAGAAMTTGRPDLADLARNMFMIVALGLPAVTLSNGLRGALEAYDRFGTVATIRVFTGVWTYLAPVVLLLFTRRVDLVVLALVIGRYVGTAAFAVALWREPAMAGGGVVGDGSEPAGGVRELLLFGGWMTISNTISPLMTNMDRFLVSSVIGVTQVAFYTTPFDVVTRLFVVPEAVFGVLFPRMTRSLGGDGFEAEQLYRLSLKLLGAMMFAAAVFFVGGGHLFLTLWLGRAFADESELIMSLLAIGLFVNSVARPPYNLIQAHGRSDLTAKLHMTEFPLYFALVLAGLHAFGVLGAAMAWLVRIAIDYVILSIIARKRTSRPNQVVAEICIPLVCGCLLISVALISPSLVRALTAGALLLAVGAVFIFRILTPTEKRVCASAVLAISRIGGLVGK